MRKYNFAIVGCGRIAHRHAEHINSLGNLIAVADVKSDRSETLGKEYEANSFTSLGDMLSNETNIDVVSVCSPNGVHAEHTIQSLRAGKHVLCEKPMATSVNDAGIMISESLKANKRLFVVKQNRFNPPVEEIKRIIEEGKFGKILNVQLSCFWNRNNEYYESSDWKGKQKLDGGTLYTQFSHFIDLLYWMIGDIKEVYPILRNFKNEKIIEFEDTGVVSLEFYNGAIGTINYTVNSYKKNMEGSLTIFGEKGTVKIGGQYLNELEYQSFEGFEITDLPQGNPPNNYGFYQGSMSNHDKVYQNIVNVLNNNAEIATNGFEGLKTVEIIERIYNNAK